MFAHFPPSHEELLQGKLSDREEVNMSSMCTAPTEKFEGEYLQRYYRISKQVIVRKRTLNKRGGMKKNYTISLELPNLVDKRFQFFILGLSKTYTANSVRVVPPNANVAPEKQFKLSTRLSVAKIKARVNSPLSKQVFLHLQNNIRCEKAFSMGVVFCVKARQAEHPFELIVNEKIFCSSC